MAITEIKNKSFSTGNVIHMDGKRFFGWTGGPDDKS